MASKSTGTKRAVGRRPGRPSIYIYPEIRSGKTEELLLAEVCDSPSKGNLRAARGAILNAAKRNGHKLKTEIVSYLDQDGDRYEMLRITREKEGV